MITIAYQAYLDSNKWKALRLRIIKDRGHKCQDCGSTKHLQVHHLTYDRIFKERDTDLRVVCQDCHNAIHHGKKRGMGSLRVGNRRKRKRIYRQLRSLFDGRVITQSKMS